MGDQSMELWSNDILTEFAIKFNSAIVVKTFDNPDLTIKMIDESPYNDGYDLDWHYTLSQWVIYYLANKYVVSLDSKIHKQKEFEIHNEDIEDNEVNTSSYTRVNDTIKVKRKQPPKPGLKCHFCNLKYCLEEERNEHEEFWHSNKLIKS